MTDANVAQGFFNTDPLIRWVAPFDGTVTVNATASRVSVGDTVGLDLKAELYVNNTLINSAQVAWNDLAAHPLATNLSQTVVAGDRIYMRVVAVGDATGQFNDGLAIALTAAYTQASVTAKYGSNGSRNVNERDPLGFPIFSFNNQADPQVVGMPIRTWHLTGNGDVGVARCFTKGLTADDVKVSYVVRDKAGKVFKHFDLSIPGTSAPTLRYRPASPTSRGPPPTSWASTRTRRTRDERSSTRRQPGFPRSIAGPDPESRGHLRHPELSGHGRRNGGSDFGFDISP